MSECKSWVCVCVSFCLEGTIFTAVFRKACVPKFILILKSSFRYEKNLLLLSSEADKRSSHENQMHYSYEPSSLLLSDISLRKKTKQETTHLARKIPHKMWLKKSACSQLLCQALFISCVYNLFWSWPSTQNISFLTKSQIKPPRRNTSLLVLPMLRVVAGKKSFAQRSSLLSVLQAREVSSEFLLLLTFCLSQCNQKATYRQKVGIGLAMYCRSDYFPLEVKEQL